MQTARRRASNTTHETLTALLRAEARLGGYYKFAFVRNPWDRLVSFHAYAREKLRPTVPQMQGLDFGNLLRLMDRGAAWLDRLYACSRKAVMCAAPISSAASRHWKATSRVCAASLDIRATLPCKNTSEHGSYAGYYDAWGSDFVARRYADDIDEFGYASEATS